MAVVPDESGARRAPMVTFTMATLRTKTWHHRVRRREDGFREAIHFHSNLVVSKDGFVGDATGSRSNNGARWPGERRPEATGGRHGHDSGRARGSDSGGSGKLLDDGKKVGVRYFCYMYIYIQ